MRVIKHWQAATPAAVGALALLAAAALLLPGRLWSALGRMVVGHWLVLLLAVAGATGLAVGWVLWRRSRLAGESSAAPVPPQRPLRPLPTWMIVAGALVVAGITWAAVWALQATVPAGVGTPLEAAQLRVETIRTGLSVGAGAGAAAALLLALRRQQVTERTQQATEYDAGEKRVTELYVKAAEQLGSDKAPVRLAGLYALERLAQDNPVHRQSIVEVVCAYLRMPYIPPAGKRSAEDASNTAGPDQLTQPDPREERQVRLAAQRILARHLRPTTPDDTPSSAYWTGMTVDLTEATLVDADFANCVLNDARFGEARFIGDTLFNSATFNGTAWFGRATFAGLAGFNGAMFNSAAWFGRATFTGEARFDTATFNSIATFGEVAFSDVAVFDRATFTGDAQFDGATVAGLTRFDGATFSSTAWFTAVQFARLARFDGTTFAGKVSFDGAKFTDSARFNRATFTSDASFDGARFGATARFAGTVIGSGGYNRVGGATFHGMASFLGTKFSGNALFGGVKFIGGALFFRSTFEKRLSFDGAVAGDGNHDDGEWPSGWKVDLGTRRVVRVPVDATPEPE
ncbi:pentapeptide repeat protein [Micromonospora sp. Llam0]|uniref:pentapeptide repeat-containing protein n=1 Tax=Micromonospora sp. Llam0 TaxID=2485143 RepID=UPI000FB0EE03|nr:pentapeptide repeat-containing protein [Micromonospora sp. Llam0]ROO60052.1 pentapeptide repeat protein [Micromonospora sp. Llam0]